MVVRLEDDANVRRTSTGRVVRSTPTQRANTARANQWTTSLAREVAQNAAVPYSAALSAARQQAAGRLGGGQQTMPATPQRSGGSGSGTVRSYGGGGGGGGGPSAAALAQGQMDYLTKLLASGQFTAAPETGSRNAVAQATAADQAAATQSFDALDAWLNANNANPYANVQLQRANVSQSYNPYLESQGVAPLNQVTQNPEDGYGAFSNVLALLGANQQSGNQSRQAESQMSRAYTGNQIGAMDNAFLAQISGREAQRQQALDDQKRQALAQLAELIGAGAKAPDLPSMGVYAPGGNAQDPYGWAAIRASLDAQK